MADEVKVEGKVEEKVETPVRTPDPSKNEIYLKGDHGCIVTRFDELSEWVSNPLNPEVTLSLMWGGKKYKYEDQVVKGKALDVICNEFFNKAKAEKRMPQWGKPANQEKIDSLINEFLETYGNGTIEGLKDYLKTKQAELDEAEKAKAEKAEKAKGKKIEVEIEDAPEAEEQSAETQVDDLQL